MEIIRNLRITDNGAGINYEYQNPESEHVKGHWFAASADLPLKVIRLAWDAGYSFETLCDGFGAGMGTCGGDWSGIRDSSPEAVERMLAAALTFLSLLADRNAQKLAGMR